MSDTLSSHFASRTRDQEPPELSILIVGYNSTSVISACIASIATGCTQHSYETLFVDNGDGSTEAFVKKHFPDVTIIPSQGNIGFAGGNNLLAASARGKYLLLLNPDLELKPGAVDALLKGAASYCDAAAWGGVTLDRQDKPDLGNSVHVPSLGEMASRLLGRSNARLGATQILAADAQVEALSGSFVMFDRTAWEEVGGLDDRYFLYCEEVDLFYRLGQKGYDFWRVSNARAFHDIGHGGAISPLRMLYRAAGTMQFTRHHWSRLSQHLAFVFLWLGALQRLVAGRLFGKWWPHLRTVGDGHRDIALRPGLWRHGYDEQKGLLAQLNGKQAGNKTNSAWSP